MSTETNGKPPVAVTEAGFTRGAVKQLFDVVQKHKKQNRGAMLQEMPEVPQTKQRVCYIPGMSRLGFPTSSKLITSSQCEKAPAVVSLAFFILMRALHCLLSPWRQTRARF